MLHFADTPTLLVEHWIIDHAADRQLAIFLDRVILQIFVDAIAIDQVSPIRVSLANSTAERHSHYGALDIERFVILDYADRFVRVE